ncbi:hemerythrin domain-containing protein [Nitrospira sp. Nam74]
MATLRQKLSNPLDMLASDHLYVKGLFKKCLAADSAVAQRLLLQELADNLLIHATLEEELFYPALKGAGGDEGSRFVEEAMREHDGIKHRLNELQQTGVLETGFRTRLEALEEAVLRHAEREERIFPLAEKQLSLGELARRMDLRRMQLMARVRPPSGLIVIGLVIIGVGLFAFLTRRR